MRPPLWKPPVKLSAVERTIVQRMRRATLFVVLRAWRHELFEEEFRSTIAPARISPSTVSIRAA